MARNRFSNKFELLTREEYFTYRDEVYNIDDLSDLYFLKEIYDKLRFKPGHYIENQLYLDICDRIDELED